MYYLDVVLTTTLKDWYHHIAAQRKQLADYHNLCSSTEKSHCVQWDILPGKCAKDCCLFSDFMESEPGKV